MEFNSGFKGLKSCSDISIADSEGGNGHPAYTNTKEGQLDWSHHGKTKTKM